MFESEIQDLKRLRDELRVQYELGKLEARDRWQDLEKRWEQLEGHLHQAEQGAREDLKDVQAAAKLLADEIREGYTHLRQSL